MSERDRFDRFDDTLDRITDRHFEDDGDADREDAAFAKADAMHRKRLIEKRHELANKATVARLQADEMFLEIKKLDKEIEEFGHGAE